MRLTPDKFMAALPLPEVYRVGGSVRDELLGRESKDSDYMVRGVTRQDLKASLSLAGAEAINDLRLRDGRVVGCRIRARGLGLLEIALPRTERSTGPGHRDFEIVVDPNLSLEDDAVRRDFTINALYRDVRTGDVHDPLQLGLVDLAHKQIQTTHPDSFRDDPLRTLRALRFLSKLDGFELGPTTFTEMAAHADAVTGLTAGGYASGTVLHELSGILMGARPGLALRIMRDTGVMAVLLPELAPMLGFEQRSVYHTKTTDEHTFDAVQAAANMHDHAPLRVRLALLFHDSGKPDTAWTGVDGKQHYYGYSGPDPDATEAQKIDHEVHGAERAGRALRRLGASTRLRQDVETLVRRHMLPLHQNVKPTKVRYWRADLGDDMLRDLVTHRLADVIGKGGDTEEAVEVLQWIVHVQNLAIRDGVPRQGKDLKINGHDLMEIGLEGPDIGRVQKALLHEVIAQPKLNERDWLLRRAEKLARQG